MRRNEQSGSEGGLWYRREPRGRSDVSKIASNASGCPLADFWEVSQTLLTAERNKKVMNEKNDKKEKQRTRKNRIFFRVDDDELKFIQAKMKVLNIKNREAYLRKMAIDGECIRYDYSDFESEMRKNNYLINNAAKSVNQIAKRVNSTSNFYDEDLQDLREKFEILRTQQIEIMKFFMKMTEEKNSGLHKNTSD